MAGNFFDSLEPRKLLAGHGFGGGRPIPGVPPTEGNGTATEVPLTPPDSTGTDTGKRPGRPGTGTKPDAGTDTGTGTDATPRGPRGGGEGQGPRGLGDLLDEYGDDPTIVADLAAIKADKQAIAATNEEWLPTLKADRKALRAAVAALADSEELAALRTNLQEAFDSVKDTIRADRKAIRAVEAKYAREIRADYLALREATTDEEKAAAQAALDEDIAARDAEVAPLKEAMETHLAPVTAARAAIEAFFDADVTYAAAKAKLTADLAAYKAVIDPQLEDLKADREKLAADLKALADADDSAADDSTTDDGTV